MIPLISWRPSNRDDALLPAKREGPIAFWGSSGVCVGCCLGEDANLAAAPLVQSLFFRPRGRWPPRGRRRYAMVVGALVPSDATRVATSWRNSVHKCPKTAPRGHFCRSVYTPASPRLSTTSQQCTRMPQNGSERPFSSICVHSCVPTTARATGWGHGSHDIDGPMALVMPGRLDLRLTPPGQ